MTNREFEESLIASQWMASCAVLVLIDVADDNRIQI